jgi:hypothetical protein
MAGGAFVFVAALSGGGWHNEILDSVVGFLYHIEALSIMGDSNVRLCVSEVVPSPGS